MIGFGRLLNILTRRLPGHKKEDKASLIAPKVLRRSDAEPELREYSYLFEALLLSIPHNDSKIRNMLTILSLFTSMHVFREDASA